MKKITFFLSLFIISINSISQQIDQTFIWPNTTHYYGQKLYYIDAGVEYGRTDLRIATKHNSTTYSDKFVFTSTGQMGINSMVTKGIIYGYDSNVLGTGAWSYSQNLFHFNTQLDAPLGLHAYVYRRQASTDWAGATVRLSSAADGNSWSQDHNYNNLNWIDFIGNKGGLDFGAGAGIGANLSIRPEGKIGINTRTPAATLDVTTHASVDPIRALTINVESFNPQNRLLSHYFRAVDLANPQFCPFLIRGDGNVGIGTGNPQYSLDVYGTIRAKEVLVNLEGGADFVFEENYKLKPIGEVYEFVKENKHLPDVSPASDMVKEGLSIGAFQTTLLQKIEELTLYVAQQNEISNNQAKMIEEQQTRILELERKLKK